MNENILDVLLYLFENFSLMDVDATMDVRQDLGEAGFFPEEIDGAFQWLHATQDEGRAGLAAPASESVRIYNSLELRLLDTACRGYITRLEQANVLSATTRELVIGRLLALADDEFDRISLDQVKWVVMMILSSSEGQEMAQARMEALLHAETPGASH